VVAPRSLVASPSLCVRKQGAIRACTFCAFGNVAAPSRALVGAARTCEIVTTAYFALVGKMMAEGILSGGFLGQSWYPRHAAGRTHFAFGKGYLWRPQMPKTVARGVLDRLIAR